MTEPGVKQCMAYWCATHKEVVQSPYMTSWGKDQAIMKQVLDTYGMDKTIAMIHQFFVDMKQDEFLKKTGASVGIFKTQIPKLIFRLQQKQEKKATGRL